MLLAITHIRFGVRVETRFALKDFAKGEAELAVAGGNDVDISVDENKARIELPEGAQEFTLEAEDEDAVTVPSTTSKSSWSEPPPTTSSTDTTSSEPPTDSTSPTDSGVVVTTG